MLEDHIIEKIIEVWSLDQAHPLRERVQSPLPPFPQIKRVIEIAFLASLEREEGRPIRFALILVDPEIGEKLSGVKRSQEYLLHLQTPLPLSVDSIAKLAPALDPGISAMAVGPSGKGDELIIWGVFTFSPTSHRFSDIPMWVYGELAYRPDFFTVYVNNAGSLLIARHHNQIGRILNGEFLPATPSPFTLKSLGRYIMDSILTHALYEKYGQSYWRNYTDILELLLSEGTARGHGSIFVLLPPDNLQEKYYIPRFRFNEKIGIQVLLDQLLRDDLDVPTSIAVRKTVVERVKFLAQLGTIDGAVILTSEMELVCFGAMLSAPQWSGPIITGPDGLGEGGGEGIDQARLGTRHNSAFSFASKYEGSLVFIISQDGPVRAVVLGENNTLLYWPDCCSVSMSL